MSTKQYASYISELTGKKKSPQSVANDCRNGKLNCYRDGDNGDWRIIVKRNYVPASKYDELLDKYNAALTTLAGIRKMVI